MEIINVVAQVRELLQQQGRLSYRIIQRQFTLDAAALEDVKFELIEIQDVAVDKDGKMLVWKGAAAQEAGTQGLRASELRSAPSLAASGTDKPKDSRLDTAERRQLTVMFCDLVGSTALSVQLDPEELREVVRYYQHTCAEVIQRHGGYIAQYLGDGLLVYFGYPTAHEDDARRAVRSGLEIIEVLRHQGAGNEQRARYGALQVRIGIHTGLVVVGEIGVAGRPEHLALGETPNIAARLQGLADPNTVLVSAATQRLIAEHFESQPFGSHLVKGVATPLAIYHVQSERQSASPLAGRRLLTPLVGREQEVGILIDRWEQAKEGWGHVVLLSGEPGIGKSRLAYTLREHVTAEGSLLFEVHCSPYHQQSALYPVIEVLQRTLLFTRQDTEGEKVHKLERALTLYAMGETLPLFTALLSLPAPSHYPLLQLTPQKQKERTLHALLQLIVAQAERQATVSVWEDVHWADPSSLEFLSLLIEQISTIKLLLVLTFRPEFTPPWRARSHLSQLVLNRLGQKHVEALIEKAAAGHPLPAEVVEQIRAKTDGVPLFVEEVTKSVVESAGGSPGSSLTLAIPATLQEALLARLDRLASARQVAQVGSILGREFSYELLHAVVPGSAADLHAALDKLVAAEIVYQRGIGEQAGYVFKHALIQDTAYQSLLKSTRQQYHQQIAQVLEERFAETTATQPELLAHHYTEAGLSEQALPYWQRAGQKAITLAANVEAGQYLTRGLSLVEGLPDTVEHLQQELTFLITLASPLVATKGTGSLEVERVFRRAYELCHRLGETPQLFSVLFGLRTYFSSRGEAAKAKEVAEQLMRLAERVQDRDSLLQAHIALGIVLFHAGDFVGSRRHCEQALTFYDPEVQDASLYRYGYDLGIASVTYVSWTLWVMGALEQSQQKNEALLALGKTLPHPQQAGGALLFAALLSLLRREAAVAQACAAEAMALGEEQGSAFIHTLAVVVHGCAWLQLGEAERGVEAIERGLGAYESPIGAVIRPYFLAVLAEAYGQLRQETRGKELLTEAFALMHRSKEYWCEAELYRLKGELLLVQEGSPIPALGWREKRGEVEECFSRARAIAQRQQAKSWELRASMSLARLWQQQGKQRDARQMLAEIYNWFTEGFDTKDLQEAKALLAELGEEP